MLSDICETFRTVNIYFVNNERKMLVFMSLDLWFLSLYCWHQRGEGLSPRELQSLFQQWTVSIFTAPLKQVFEILVPFI